MDPHRHAFTLALERTFASASPVRVRSEENWEQFEAPKGVFEDRLAFICGLPDGWRPADEWIRRALKMIVTRWEAGVGGKAEALRLLEAVNAGELSVEAEHALEQWLARSRAETEDWNRYFEFLERTRGNAYVVDVADEFSSHARNELERWDPSPPNLDDLINHAEGLGLAALLKDLGEKAQEDEERDASARQRVTAKPRAEAVKPSPDDSDEMIEGLFRRLSQQV